MPTRAMPLPAALRQRRYRRRQREGASVGLVEVSPSVVEALIRAGHLTPAAALDTRRLFEASGDALEKWAADVLASGTPATFSHRARRKLVEGGAECRLPEVERPSSVGGSHYGF